jgi:hypothetical protein
VRAKILENLVDWGDLKPKNTANSSAGPGFSITINIPTVGQTPAKTIVLEAENAENLQKTSKFDEDEIKMLGLPRKQEISLAEGDDYEYAGDDYT